MATRVHESGAAQQRAVKIRPLQADDLPAVAQQYEALVRSGRAHASLGLVAAFRDLFMDTAVSAPDIPSWVIETEAGISGFQGVQVREFDFKGERRRMASLGPLFIAPELRGRAAGVLLMKRALNGPQDLTVSDGATDEARRMWEQLGGTMAVPQSLQWTVALEPAKLLAQLGARRYRGSGMRSAMVGAVKPLAALADRFIARRWRAPFMRPFGRVPDTSLLSPDALCEIAGKLAMQYRLQVVYSRETADWLFAQLASFTCRGELLARAVSLRGRPLGWFIAYASQDGILSVMQLQAAAADVPRVLVAVLHEALQRRLLAVTGRLDGALPSALTPYRPQFAYGTRVLVHAREREIVDAVLSLDASMARVDGEWLMDIRQQPYGDAPVRPTDA